MTDKPNNLMSEDIIISRLCSVGTPAPGSIRYPCNDCKREVWLSPTSQARLRDLKVPAVCMACGQKRMDAHKDGGGVPPVIVWPGIGSKPS